MWHLYAFRGLRRGEAAGLERPEVDLESGTIAIVRQRLDIGDEAQEDTPKSDAGPGQLEEGRGSHPVGGNLAGQAECAPDVLVVDEAVVSAIRPPKPAGSAWG